MRRSRRTPGVEVAGTAGTNLRRGKAADVELTVRRFNPSRIPPEVWVDIGPLVRHAVLRAEPRHDRDARELMTRTAHLASWCHQRGVELRSEVVFAAHIVDRFVTEGCAHLAEGSRANYRSVLHRVGAAVLGPLVYPPRPTFRASPRLAPYSETEVRALVGWSRGLATSQMRDNTQALLGLGLGAGLKSEEISVARTRWVEHHGTGLVITVPGERARRVPVGAEWEWAVSAAVVRSGQGLLFLPDRSTVTAKQLSRFVEGLPRHDAPKLSARRLRATWIVRQLDSRVPLSALAAAAGVLPEILAEYTPYTAPVPDEVADRLLRGEA
jgi:hypothetical protein